VCLVYIGLLRKEGLPILYKEYEYQRFCPFVGIGSPNPLPRKRVCLPPIWVLGGPHSLAKEGVGGPNSDEGTDTLVLYMYVYCIIPLRLTLQTELYIEEINCKVV
jgi:hypothetical protein